jgi:hypothetical protein
MKVVSTQISTWLLLLLCTACGHPNIPTDNAPKKRADKVSDVHAVNHTTKGSITSIAEMINPRAAHTATLLASGSVLICGGFAKATLSSAEIFDEKTGKFSLTNNISVPRAAHTATLLPDGKVLITGGFNGSYLRSTEIFDPATGKFAAGPVMNVARSGHTATVLKDGKILFSGGVGEGWSFLASAEIYDIKTSTFTLVAPMTTARESHTATLLKDGTVLITGGHKDRRQNITIYSSAEIYNPQTQKFTSTGNMNIARHKHDAVLLSNGKVLITGGSDEKDADGTFNSTEIYDPSTRKFNSAPKMNYTRYKHIGTSVLLKSNKVFIGGGTSVAEIYDVDSNKFYLVSKGMNSKRLFSCVTLLKNENVLLTGGYNENMVTSAGAWLFTDK